MREGACGGLGGCAKVSRQVGARSAPGRRQRRWTQKHCFSFKKQCLIHLSILKKNMLLASTKRQVGVSLSNENNVFFLNSQMYGVKTLLFRFEHSFINVFSKHQFYRFFKDVLNKTLTFEVPIPPKMEAGNNTTLQEKRYYTENQKLFRCSLQNRKKSPNFSFWAPFW